MPPFDPSITQVYSPCHTCQTLNQVLRKKTHTHAHSEKIFAWSQCQHSIKNKKRKLSTSPDIPLVLFYFNVLNCERQRGKPGNMWNGAQYEEVENCICIWIWQIWKVLQPQHALLVKTRGAFIKENKNKCMVIIWPALSFDVPKWAIFGWTMSIHVSYLTNVWCAC